MTDRDASQPLQGIRVVTLAVNVPGPAAAAQLRHLGATVVKVEPPGGDPLARGCRAWYDVLTAGQDVVTLDLKEPGDRSHLDEILVASDLLLTSTRPAALARLGLSWPELHARFPRLCQVAIVGYPTPVENLPGHDLTYLAPLGLLTPPQLPRTLLADLAGSERAVSRALALLLARERGRETAYAEVALADVAESFAAPRRYGITAPGGRLGGGLPFYNLYRTRQGWIAVGALELHFWQRLQRELGLDGATHQDLSRAFLTRTADDWEAWALQRDLPIAVVRDPGDG